MKVDKLISRGILSLIFVLLFASISLGQKSLKLGNRFFKKGKYCVALRHYNDYLKNYSDKNAFFKRGVCNYHCGRYKGAIEDLQNSRYLGNYDDNVDKYLALVYHESQDFEKAIVYYKKLLSKFNGSKSERNEIMNNIKRCANGLFVSYFPTSHFIENCGSEINSKLDDILPIQSPNDSNVFYIASNRNYSADQKQFYDEFRVGYVEGNWTELPPVINKKTKDENMMFLDFYNYGTKAIVFSGSYLGSGKFYSYNRSNKKSDSTTKENFLGSVRSEYGFSYVQFVNDSTIVFSSNKKGGYGGYDLYISGYRNGYWFKPINLGPKINTRFDEISPYMTPDAENIYYSSNGLESIGGFDILHSQFSHGDYQWLEPVNLGVPINSPFDEYGYRFLKSGKGGVFNSNRKDFGLGGQDIYWVYYKQAASVSKGYPGEVPYLKYKRLVPMNGTEKGKYSKKNQNKKKGDSGHKKVTSQVVTKDKKNKSKSHKKDTFDTKNDKKADKGKKGLGKENVNSPHNIKNVNRDKVAKNSDFSKDNSAVNKESEEFIIPRIFTHDNGFKENETLYAFLNKLGRLMKKYSRLKIEIVGNTFNKERKGKNIVNSVDIAKRFADSLKLRMIDGDRIIVRGVGDNFPVANPNGPVVSKNIISKLNNRLDIYLHDYENIPITVKYEPILISSKIKDYRCELYRANLIGLSYKVLVKVGDFLSYNELLNKYPDSWIETDGDHKIYYYTIGLYQKYSQAKNVYNKIIQIKGTRVRVVPYIDGVRIDRRQALKYAKTYTDLVNYLENK